MTEATGGHHLVAMPGQMDCPNCGAVIEFDRRFTPWCVVCEWNVEAGMPPGPTGRLDRRRTALARRLATRSLADLAIRSVDRPPRWTLATIILWAMALGILGTWVLLAAAGIWLLLSGNLLVQVVGAVVLLVALVSRPRLGDRPETTLDRADAPETYALLDSLSAAMNAPRIAALGIDADWNASTYRFGVRQRHAVVFGLPLWHALSDEGRLAILAHEIAHGVNGDSSRGMVVGTAIRTLLHWIDITEPDALADEGDGFGGLMSLPGNIVLLGISLLLTSIAEVLFVLSFAPSLRAELYADRLAARMVGTASVVEGLETTRHAPAYIRTIQRVALGQKRGETDLFSELRAQLAATPSSELERLRRQEGREPYRLDQVHPPTSERVALLQRAVVPARVTLEDLPARMRRIDQEFAAMEPRIAQEVVEEYLSALS